MRFIALQPPSLTEVESKMLSACLREYRELADGLGSFAAIEKATGQMVGRFRQGRQQLRPDRRHGARPPAVSGVLGTWARCGMRRVRTFCYPDADLMPGAEHGDRSLSRCDAPATSVRGRVKDA
jgi:hypothetical protein